MPAMPRNPTSRRAAKRTKPTEPAKSAAPTSLAEWKARAVSVMGGRAGTMPHREWRRLFVLGTTAEDAAKIAETYRQNTGAADRKRRR